MPEIFASRLDDSLILNMVGHKMNLVVPGCIRNSISIHIQLTGSPLLDVYHLSCHSFLILLR